MCIWGAMKGTVPPFDLEVSADVLQKGLNTIVLSVSNFRLEGYAGEPVSGLTTRAANEYTGGITGDVALRVYHGPLKDVVILVSEDCMRVTVQPESLAGELTGAYAVYDEDRLCKEGTFTGKFAFDTCGLECWSPENPKLYTLKVTCEGQALERNFGVRRLTVDGVHLRLNGTPYYLRGICEHCYFPETVHPNHDRNFYRKVIKEIKKLGFNFIRFHTFVPEEEYLQAADELGMLVHIESPNNTTLKEWEEIVRFSRRHTCAVIYCCGNELLMDEPFIDHLRKCGNTVHALTDALFSPMNAMRGLEYYWVEPEQEAETKAEPFKHHPRRLQEVGAYSDIYSSYPNGEHSYFSLNGDAKRVDAWNCVYQKPRISHEICIDGTYTDLSLKDRYKNTRVGRTDMFVSLERHLEKKGVLSKAPLYFKNSSEWQRRVRKYCFENVRRCENIAGYDFLGPIDTHWHTFGYDVGMMNEFYELKPGETVRNVRMYNGATVLLNDLGRKTNFSASETVNCNILVSHFGKEDLINAQLMVRLTLNCEVIQRRSVSIAHIQNGKVSAAYTFTCELPDVTKPGALKCYVTLDGDGIFAENEWEWYVFPKASAFAAIAEAVKSDQLVVTKGMPFDELEACMAAGKDVLLLGTEPFGSLPTSYQIALAGRTSGNLATVVKDHPVLKNLPNEGFCGWQFGELLEGGRAISFETDAVPFEPILEVVSCHKYVIKQSALFEFAVESGRLLVCSLNIKENDPAGQWLIEELIRYMQSEEFVPEHELEISELRALAEVKIRKAAANTNLAFNANDKTAVRKRK